MNLIDSKKLVLAVSNEPGIGWNVPSSDEIFITGKDNPYSYYLFDDVDILSMNSLELKVGDILERQEKILWWFRNKTGKEWYSIQGWKRNKIRPDFVAAKKDGDKVEVVYVLESKGKHLAGNDDTDYKKKVLDIMTSQKKSKKVQKYVQNDLPFDGVSDSIESYLIDEGQEEASIRELFK